MKIAYLMQYRPDYLPRLLQDVEHVIVAAQPDKTYSAEDLARVADVDAIVVSLEPITAQLIAACPKLKIIQRLGVGYENLDLEAAAKRGIPCCNTAGVNKESVAEHGMLLILALARNLLATDRLTREDRWQEAKLLTGSAMELQGKTLGIVGLGDTGSHLARRAKAFGMQIVYNDIREIDARIVEELGARSMEKDQLFAEADVISINTTYNATSANMIDARALALMKPHARLVCCARGGIVDEAALADALNAGRLAGAGIDVFAAEPTPSDNPLLGAKNVVVTSHVAGVTPEATNRNFDWAHQNVRAVVERGEKPRFVRNGVT